jgi:uncharacterized protein YndB with AHSA1/START domain
MSQLPPGTYVGERMTIGASKEALTIPQPIERVWRAWTDPSWLCGWHAERVEGEVATGGSIELAWDSMGIAIELAVEAALPPRRLVLSGAPPGRPLQTLTIELEPDAGGTRVAIEHRGFASAEEQAGTAAGWHTMARILAHYLAHHAGRARTCAATLAPVAASLADIEPLFRDPRGWLAPIDLGGEGERFAGGPHLSGVVLARALPRQVALAVDPVAGAVVLRAIQLDPGAALVGVISWSWEPDRPAWPILRDELERAVARLAGALGAGRGGDA